MKNLYMSKRLKKPDSLFCCRNDATQGSLYWMWANKSVVFNQIRLSGLHDMTALAGHLFKKGRHQL